MKIRILSDLHLEFGDLEPITNEQHDDVLVLAGDIITPHAGWRIAYDRFFSNVSKQFDKVFYVIGNHEHYGGDFHSTPALMYDKLGEYSNIFVLDNQCYHHAGVNFIGSTLWTDCDRSNPITMMYLNRVISDFNIIKYHDKKFMTVDSVFEHENSLGFIQETLDRHRGENNVVITHHAPSYQSVAEKYRNLSSSMLNRSFYSDLVNVIVEYQPKLWIHGHMHNKCVYNIDNTWIVCNPRGYYGIEPTADYNTNFYVEI